MRRVVLGLALSFLMLGALLVPAGLAQATRPTRVEATLTITSAEVTSFREAGAAVLLTLDSTADLTGALDGSYAYELRLVIHPSGMGTYQVTGTFTGEVDGRSGTADLDGQGMIDFATGQQSGQWQVTIGTDGLAGLHVQGTLEGPLGGPISLVGWMHFDP